MPPSGLLPYISAALYRCSGNLKDSWYFRAVDLPFTPPATKFGWIHLIFPALKVTLKYVRPKMTSLFPSSQQISPLPLLTAMRPTAGLRLPVSAKTCCKVMEQHEKTPHKDLEIFVRRERIVKPGGNLPPRNKI